MNITPEQALADTPNLIDAWEFLSLRMRHATRVGFEADVSPEEMHGTYRIERALQQIEEAGRALWSTDSVARSIAIKIVLGVYRSDSNGLRAEIQQHARDLAGNHLRGTEPFAYSARLLVAAATTIAEAARLGDDSGTLREIHASVEAAASGLLRCDYTGAEALSKVLSKQLYS